MKVRVSFTIEFDAQEYRDAFDEDDDYKINNIPKDVNARAEEELSTFLGDHGVTNRTVYPLT